MTARPLANATHMCDAEPTTDATGAPMLDLRSLREFLAECVDSARAWLMAEVLEVPTP